MKFGSSLLVTEPVQPVQHTEDSLTPARHTADNGVFVSDSAQTPATDTAAMQPSQVHSTLPYPAFKGEPRPETLKNSPAVFPSLLFCFVCYALVCKSFPTYLKSSINSIFRPSYAHSDLTTEHTTLDFWENTLLLFLTMIVSAVTLFKYFSQTCTVFPSHRYTMTYVLCFAVILALFFLLRRFFYFLLGYLLALHKTVRRWQRNYLTILNFYGVLAFVMVLPMIYSTGNSLVYVYVVFGLFIITRLLVFYRQISFFLHKRVSIFVIFLYLCSVEILPYILLYKGIEWLFCNYDFSELILKIYE